MTHLQAASARPTTLLPMPAATTPSPEAASAPPTLTQTLTVVIEPPPLAATSVPLVHQATAPHNKLEALVGFRTVAMMGLGQPKAGSSDLQAEMLDPTQTPICMAPKETLESLAIIQATMIPRTRGTSLPWATRCVVRRQLFSSVQYLF